MLVATPGQSATYSLLGSNAPKKTCLSTSATPKGTTIKSTVAPSSCNSNKSSNSAASTLMKTISVRLNRGTEFLKDTVHKALVNSTANSKNIATSVSSISFRNNHLNNLSTSAITSLKNIKPTSAIATAVHSSNILGHKTTQSVALAATVSNSSNLFARASISTNTASKTLKLNTVAPTYIHRYPQERQDTNSTDSIHKEMCHFKPIISAPTMRWKCGSKSRGSAIKIPTACLAKNIKNLDCDDCLIIEAYSSSDDERRTNEDEKLKEEAGHPHKYIYRPKPTSTLLTANITSPNHQSAFVRLVAEMKTLVNIQQTTRGETHSRVSKNIETYKIRQGTHRGRPSKAGVSLKMSRLRKSPLNSPLTQIFLRSRKKSIVQMKKLKMPTDLIIKKGKGDADTTNSNKSNKGIKEQKLTSPLPVHISTKKGKRNRTKSKVINIVAFAQTGSTEKSNRNDTESANEVTADIVTNAIKQRKRKRIEISNSTYKLHGSDNHEMKTDFNEPDAMPPLRKSARLSKNGSNLLIGTVKRITVKKHKTRSMSRRLSDSFSPPMTRSRLKELMQQHSITSEVSNSVQLAV